MSLPQGCQLIFCFACGLQAKGCERVKSKPSYIMQSGEKGSVASPEDAPATLTRGETANVQFFVAD